MSATRESIRPDAVLNDFVDVIHQESVKVTSVLRDHFLRLRVQAAEWAPAPMPPSFGRVRSRVGEMRKRPQYTRKAV